MANNPWIPQRPHPRQQQFLLHSHTLEVLYGGAAGGGKSSAALMAAAQFVDVPGYAALLLRSSFPDLMQPDALIPRSKDWWMDRRVNGRKATWNVQEHRWTFPSGATLTFGYLERDDDVYQYQSAAYQHIAIDELTQHTAFRYRYLFSRLRRPSEGPLSRVPLRMRGYTNPGGKGHEWVKARFINAKTRVRGAVFVPAKLQDNPSLDAKEYIRGLAHLDPISRDQLLKGDWDAYVGGRFKKEWFAATRYVRKDVYYLFGDKSYVRGQITGVFLTVDPASTEQQLAKNDPDWTVISAWGVTPCGKLVWLGCKLVKCEIPDIPPHVAEMYARHGATLALVEGFGIGKGPAQLCKRHPLHMNVIEVTPKGKDKLVNAANAMNMAEAGRVWLPANDPLFPLEEVEGQLFRFTGNEKQDGHDDVIDTLSMAANRITARERATGTTKVAGELRPGGKA